MSKDIKYCVYLHRRKDTKEIVYVGEGRLSRAKSISSRAGRNKNYNKLVDSVGLYSEIYQDDLTKEEAEALEESLIVELRSEGHPLTNKNRRSTTALEYRKEDFEDLFYIDPKSPSGLRWKTDRYNLGDKGTLLAVKDDVAGCRNKLTGYWYYCNYACHRIVYALVHGVCPARLTIDHLDKNKSNNCISNFELVTAGENSSRARVGCEPKRGSDVNGSKVTEEQILQMYALFREGKNNEEVANLFGLHSRYVSLVRHGKRWKHLYIDHGKGIPSSFTATKHTEEQIMWVYDLVTNSDMTNKNISILTGMEVSTVSRLRSGKMFRRVIERNLNK